MESVTSQDSSGVESVENDREQRSGWTGWWQSADESSFAWMLVMLVVILALRVIAMGVNLDQLTTVDLRNSLFYRGAMIGVFIAASAFAARSWFGAAPDIQYRMPMGRMRRERSGVWLLCGALWITVACAVSAWELSEGLGIAAQYLHGSIESIRGVVVANRPVSTPRTVCSQRLLVSIEDDKSLSICLYTKYRRSLSSVPLKSGDLVVIHMRTTSLGRVVLSVEATGN